MATNSANYLSDLHRLLNQHFKLEQIYTLCFDLGMDYEDLGGKGKSAHTREFLIALGRNGRLPELVRLVREQHPGVTWPPVPGDFQLPASFGSSGLEDGSPARSKAPLPYEPEMVEIPAGSFLMGADDDPLAGPQCLVDLPAYHIGLYPITNEQFEHFILQTGRVPGFDLLWDGSQPPRNQRRHPVIGVTWYEALAYCEWLAEETERPYALPSEAQWEKAARGTDGRLYPWGNDWDPTRCNANLEQITAVAAFPPQSSYGCYDMVGNSREWTTTLWGVSPREPDERYRYPWANDGRRDDLKAPSTTRRVFRGGRKDGLAAYRCAARSHYAPNRSAPPQQRFGFRVVLAGL